ncbi:hypothetical protein EC973_002944 [Apophysomyces ossiformis]|uniref:Carbohydrate esterase family 16 protein n=1 Tax=Apophysomyces ossiformis TaxID=679940 RepID=A0A8H7BJZ6_9FUNG|nr:hypothetical protein EC973_002944 [Apophysomyces ossiformis]
MATRSNLAKQWNLATSEVTLPKDGKNTHAILAGITDIIEFEKFDTTAWLKCLKQHTSSILESDPNGNVLLLGIPPLEFAPFYKNHTDQSSEIKQRVMEINAALEDMSNDNSKLTFFDTYGLFSDVLGDPSQFNIKHVDEAYWDVCQGQCLDSIDSYLWWDKIHMTGAGHKAMANAILAKQQPSETSSRPLPLPSSTGQSTTTEQSSTTEQHSTVPDDVSNGDHVQYASWLVLFGLFVGLAIFVMRPGSQFRRWLDKPRHYSPV